MCVAQCSGCLPFRISPDKGSVPSLSQAGVTDAHELVIGCDSGTVLLRDQKVVEKLFCGLSREKHTFRSIHTDDEGLRKFLVSRRSIT